MSNCEDILKTLKIGNKKFVNNLEYQEQREENYQKQTPQVIFVSCSDSRVSVPIIFDTFHIGTFFEIKTAGQVLNTSDLESIKYAVENIKPQPCLIIMLGHTNCGAVKAAIESLDDYRIRNEYPIITSTIQKSIKKVGQEKDKFYKSIVQNAIDRAEDLKFLFGNDVKVLTGIYDILTGEINWIK